MMHPGWELERALWEDQTRASRSVQEIGNAMVYLENWIALDYAPGSDVRSFLCLCLRTSPAWSVCCVLTEDVMFCIPMHVLQVPRLSCAVHWALSTALQRSYNLCITAGGGACAVPSVGRPLLSCEHLRGVLRPHAFADGGH